MLNATIDRYVYATLEPNPDEEVVFISCDREQTDRQPLAPTYELKEGLSLHRAVYNYYIEHHNGGEPLRLKVFTLAEAPSGSGLGASSTLVVALCKAFSEFFSVGMDDYELAALAYKIEREHCALAGGKQDQYAAVFGGVNFMEFMPNGTVLVNPLRIKRRILAEFESSLILYFTGVSRDSAKIIDAQAKTVMEEQLHDALEAMRELKNEAYSMKAALLTGDFQALYDTFRKGWESKKRTSSSISNEFIEEIYATAMVNGAQAAKISGAGGGGFMMCLVPPALRAGLMNALRKFGGEISPAHFTETGVEAWRT